MALKKRQINTNKIVEGNIIRLGNASSYKKSQAGIIISTKGISMTICACTHGYAIGYILEEGVI